MNKKRYVEGGITVYFALVFAVIMSLIMVLLEVALVHMGRSYYDVVADVAVQSLMGEYYLPLYDEYGILAVDLGFGEKYPNIEKGESIIKEYIEENLVKEGFAVWRMKDVGIEMKTTRITEDNGEAFFEEVVENMEYEAASSVLEALKEMLSLSKSTKEATELLVKKSEVEQTTAIMDELVLKLMEIVDGIKIGFGGRIKIKSEFVKKLFPGGASQDKAFINNDTIFEQLSDKYCDPLVLLQEVMSEGKELISLESEQNRVTANRDKLQKEISELEENCEDEDKLLKKLLLKKRIKEQDKELLQIGSAWTAESRLLQADMEEIRELVDEGLEKTEEALSVIELLKVKQLLCSEEVKKYMRIVDKAAEFLEADFLQMIIEELEILKGYAGMESSEFSENVDFSKMEKTLKANKEILNKVNSLLKKADFIPGISDYMEWYDYVCDAEKCFSDYEISGLRFDYSALCIDKTDSISPLSFFKDLVRDGISGLVLEEEISKRIIGTDALISKSFDAVKSQDIDDKSEVDVTMLLKELTNTAFSEIFADVADKAVFCGYLNSNFSSFNNGISAERVLEYELEYILMGNAADSQNLQGIIGRLVALRTLINFISINCDTQKADSAKQMATAMVGFSGVPVLVTAMKSTILLVWAFEAALVETSALLKGYYVPLLPDLQNYPVQIAELLVMTKGRIQSKSKAYKNNERFLCMSYADYINAFLLLQNKEEQTVRTMDLIQENLRLCYDDEFRFRNCMNAVKVVFDFRTGSVFGRLPFVKGSRTGAYGYEVVKRAAY